MKPFPPISQYIAHRGAPNVAPENTIASMRKAKELGASWIEFDVMLTSDDVPIIMHDYKLNRTTNGRGKVASASFAEIAKLDAGEGQHVVQLDRWLRIAAELGLGVNIEIKEPHKAAKVAEKIHQALQSCWSPELPQPIVSSGHSENLLAYRKLDADMPLALILDHWPWRCLSKLESVEASGLVINYKYLKPKRVQQLHGDGYKVLAYTVNSAADAKKLFEMGVDAVFTDDLTIQS